MLYFHPCPYHFGDLWKSRVIALPKGQEPHGFVVRDDMLMKGGEVFRSIIQLAYGVRLFSSRGLVFERAEQFSLPNQAPWVLSDPKKKEIVHQFRTVCRETAWSTWPKYFPR